jgi:hypothetical protein
MSLVEIKEVLRLAGSKSGISGATENVTIIRADPSKPLSVANAVVVTTDEAVAGLRRLPPRLSLRTPSRDTAALRKRAARRRSWTQTELTNACL